jgi:hypothetical protein
MERIVRTDDWMYEQLPRPDEPLRGHVPDHLQVQTARDPRPCPEARQTSRGSMSDWLYLIGSFCFVAGTIISMVQR